MRENKKQIIIIFVLGIIGICVMFYIYLKLLDSHELFSNYKHDLNAVVVKKRVGHYGGTELVTFSNGVALQVESFYKSTNKEDKHREIRYLNDFLQYGDSVSKKISSPFVSVYRDNKEYIYVDMRTQEKE